MTRISIAGCKASIFNYPLPFMNTSLDWLPASKVSDLMFLLFVCLLYVFFIFISFCNIVLGSPFEPKLLFVTFEQNALQFLLQDFLAPQIIFIQISYYFRLLTNSIQMCAYKSLKLLSLNVRSVSNFHKRKSIFTWFHRKKTDIISIFLQETHLTKETEIQWRNEWGRKNRAAVAS